MSKDETNDPEISSKHFSLYFLREGRGTIGPRPPLKLPSQPLLNKNAAGTARHLLSWWPKSLAGAGAGVGAWLAFDLLDQ